MISLRSRTSRAAVALVPAVVLVAALLYMMRIKDAATAPTTKAPAADSSNLPAGVDKRHEALALEAQLQKKPDHVPILTRLAQIARENGKPAEAIPYLRKIVSLEPKNAEAHLELGRDLYDTGDVAGALEQTNQVLAAEPNNADALYNMGAIYANSNKIDVARDYWKRAAASDPASDSGKRAADSLQRLSTPIR